MPDAHTVIAVFLLFCRIGACLMIAPGVGNTQIPAQIRVFVVVAATLALAPMLLEKVQTTVDGENPIGLARAILMELLIGATIGILARLFLSALETLTFAGATMIGLSNPFGVEIDQSQATPPLASLFTLGATALIFVADLHWQLVFGLVDSYKAIPFGAVFDTRRGLTEIGDVLGQSFLVAARIASPFFLYSVIINFAMALINRVTPQIAVFFIAPPFIVAGGMVLIYFTVRGQLAEFMGGFAGWLGSG
jgi:flagellar biosynthetic protein FliR